MDHGVRCNLIGHCVPRIHLADFVCQVAEADLDAGGPSGIKWQRVWDLYPRHSMYAPFAYIPDTLVCHICLY